MEPQILKSNLIIIDDERFDLHIEGTELPEKPDRTNYIRNALRSKIEGAQWISPKKTNWDIPETVHAKNYVAHVRKQCETAAKEQKLLWILQDSEVSVTEHSEWAVLHAAGAGVLAVDLVFSHNPEENRIQRVFCNTRPPGHHAYKSKGMGFCIFNNIWIAANHALNHYGPNWVADSVIPYTSLDYTTRTGLPRWKKVLVLDWDVHHGNGTEDFIMNMDQFHAERLLYIGTQQDYKTIWPNTGKPCENGGQYHNINRYNFSPGDGDKEVKELWEMKILPKIAEFQPHLILISCGFDAHVSDPLGKLKFSSELYGWMTKKLRQICPRIISMLEGGYNVGAIAEAAVEHVKQLV